MNGQLNRSGMRTLDQAMLGVQLDVLDHVARAIGAGWLTPARYAAWLQVQQSLLQACCQGIEAALGVGDGELGRTRRAWLMTHCHALRADVTLVASDLRALGAAANPEAPAARRWRQACIETHRAAPWRMLGASLLPREHLAGPASEALAAILGLPGMGSTGTGFLRRRLQFADASRYRAAEMTVGLDLDAHIWQELAGGLRTGARLHGALLTQVLQPVSKPLPEPEPAPCAGRLPALAATG